MLKGESPDEKGDLVNVKSLKEVLERKSPAWSRREGDLKERARFLFGRQRASDSIGLMKIPPQDT